MTLLLAAIIAFNVAAVSGTAIQIKIAKKKEQATVQVDKVMKAKKTKRAKKL